MPKKNQKFKLADSLTLGISGPSSQGTFFKVGGVFFLILSAVLALNIYKNVSSSPAVTTVADASQAQAADPKVLGAFDQANSSSDSNASQSTASAAPKIVNYTVQKGDTLFNIAQKFNINWVLIASANNLKAPYQLSPGAVLQVPQVK